MIDSSMISLLILLLGKYFQTWLYDSYHMRHENESYSICSASPFAKAEDDTSLSEPQMGPWGFTTYGKRFDDAVSKRASQVDRLKVQVILMSHHNDVIIEGLTIAWSAGPRDLSASRIWRDQIVLVAFLCLKMLVNALPTQRLMKCRTVWT